MRSALLLAFVVTCSIWSVASATEPPNIIVIMVDDMGFSDISCYGGEIPTPNLDALAENGLKFSQFYDTSRCCPTRASLLTGLYAHQAGMDLKDPRLEPPWYGTHLWTTFGLRFAEEAGQADKPFFWYLAHVAPHFPCMAPEATIAKYRGKYMEGWDVLREKRYARQIVSGLNVFVGECWAHLSKTPFRKYKHYNHEGDTATPLFAHWPAGINKTADQAEHGAEQETGAKSNWVRTPTHVIDIMATCVDLGGARYLKEYKGHKITPMQGRSMRPLLASGGTNTGGLEERVLFWEHEGNAAIRIGQRKGVRLGDMCDDRTEQKNLAVTERQEIIQMKADWIEWAASAQVYPKKAKANAGKTQTGKTKAAKAQKQ